MQKNNESSDKLEYWIKLLFWMSCNTILGWMASKVSWVLGFTWLDEDGFIFEFLHGTIILGLLYPIVLTVGPIMDAAVKLEKIYFTEDKNL
ncbi:hypothetical protein [Arundinibacter roseus]|uniref:Uncharacterized protein n=1 Tax=Arundinibacter roseus TaxID=2070510 RepID=A0A4R4KCF9_9BACT|nr:hypothetical protein [Arundinibacter roseus]TDB64366.1 hypothetical protein EZE20_11830 [Arundinibacter roseus]